MAGGPVVDLVFDPECPNIGEARALIRAALSDAGMTADWREWEREGADTPAPYRGLGSPTILINGTDVTGRDDGGDGANCCRVYANEGRLRGVPPLSLVVAVLRHAQALG